MATAAQQPKGGTIYDSYPLSLRSFLADGPAPFVRSLSEDPTHMSAEDDDFLATLHHTGSSVGSVLDMGDNVHARTGATRASPLCSTFGKFHNEVFETKERSKVLSALRHRGKATKAANGIKQRSAMRPPAPSTFTADDVLRAGTLTKQGSWRRNWKTRFFILRSDCPSLCYFTSEDKLELLGEIPVTEDTIVLDRSGGGHAPFRFQVRTEAQTLLLEAESRENQKRWIDSCQELADAIRASKFSVNTNSISSFSSITMGEGHRRSSLLGASSTRETMHPFRPTEKENGPAHGNNGNVSSDDDHLSASNASSSARSGAESVIANRHLYDVSVSVSMGRRSKLARTNDAPTGNLRYVAVDEILRVPRSTFALPVAFLDFLEEQALERSRWIQKQLGAKASSAAASPQAVERLNAEMDFLRKKQEEYLKQRQFIIRQEKRLLDEQKDGKFFMAAKRAGMVSVASDTKERESVANAATTAASATAAGTDNEPVAPFKRSTYKNLNLWQFLPTNMQDQFLCTYKPPTKNKKRRTGTSAALSSRPFVWHTMTMGCPAAHTKGFANGGYPASVPVMTVSPASSEDDAILESSYNGDVQSPTSPMSSSRGTTKIPSTQTSAPADDSLAAFKLRLDLQDRLTVIGSQILSATAACVLSSLDLAVSGSALHQAQLDRAPTFGYLMNFESLLSTQGKEYGMLEDFAAGARWLRNVFIQFRRHSTAGTFFSIKKYAPADESTGNGEGLLLTMGVTDDHLAVLPKSLVSGNAVVHVRCVLFTQGVNEKQSLVHAYKSSAVKLQERVNRDNLVELKRIYTIYRNLRVEETQNRVRASRQMRANSGMSSSSAQDDADEAAMAIDRHDLQALDDLLVQIEHHICSSTSQYKKNVALLMDSSDFCRALGGARITCCKSGKDRTAMSVTLEQARLLCGELQASQGSALCSNMRLYGVRRRNVFMNTKADKFAFNEVQRKMLPDCYKPPAGTYKSGKT
ncbi:Phosphatidylinositol 3,4,5-trisphosphate-dependent Rac exchanger 2 protein [Phytophthora boehmeriae]|uniref:Phosphatidylinositol 3,4,5-trisphosphate-dependent Rac exchanger 2 protein n=1 Tax=Phytophthora boehmeriae TaxID=109152 RepID=A0A8T1WZZ1_9STRA|nr:Phosphatidylinositol 3,4,5-trisphosphate-dependent Rac exchanger 2 protein [Phytophthora boehmeriae]